MNIKSIKNNLSSVLFGALLSVIFIAVSVSAATTISTNITTAGTLNVDGNSTLASVDVGGAYSGGGSGLTIAATGALTTNGDLDVGGMATTTASTGNIATQGTLTVTGNSVLLSTDIGGAYSAGGSGATVAATGALSINGNLAVNGMATTTASSGQFVTEGSIGVATSTPSTEISASGTATTTLYLTSTTDGANGKGGCIELEGPNGTVFRIYATTTGPLIAEVGVCK